MYRSLRLGVLVVTLSFFEMACSQSSALKGALSSNSTSSSSSSVPSTPTPNPSPISTPVSTPIPTPAPNPTATPSPSASFFINERIQIVNVTPTGPAHIWSAPSTSTGTFVATEQLGALGTIIGGPTTDSSGNVWYDVNFDDGTSGWDIQTYFAQATSSGPTPNPTPVSTPSPTPVPTPVPTPAPTPIPGSRPWAGVIDPSRAIDWSQAGVPGGIPNRTTICSTLNPGATAAQINSAIAACPSGQVVYLNAGTYNIASPGINIYNSNVTLRGAGPDQTFLVFSSNAGNGCNGLGAAVCINNQDGNWSGGPDNTANWTAGYTPGLTSITLDSVSGLQVGYQLILDSLLDSADTGNIFVCENTTCSQQGGIGEGRPGTNGSPVNGRPQTQMVKVTSISGSGPYTVGITPGIYMPNIRSSQSPGAWWGNRLPISGVGIENLKIDLRSDPTPNGQSGSGIMMNNTYGSWVKNVASLVNTISNHIQCYQANHNTYRDSYFYGGSPTSGSYGISLLTCADILVENNITQHIAAPLITEGAVGSVFDYNYSVDDYYGGGWQQASAYHHNAGDSFLLWESNQGIGMQSDDIHGTSNLTTAFRNYWVGLDNSTKNESTNAIALMAYSRYYNIVGNVLGTSSYFTNYQVASSSASDPGTVSTANVSIYSLGYSGDQGILWYGSNPIPNDPLTVSTLMRWGNYDTVTNAASFSSSEVPSGLSLYSNPLPSSHTLPPSFFMSSKPSWWGTMPWPAIGPDVTGGNATDSNGGNPAGHAYLIPAANCYLKVMGGATDGSSGALNFNANNCY